MCDFGGIFSEICSFQSSLYHHWILLVFGGRFLGQFWVLEIFDNGFGMEMCDFRGGVNLLKFIHLRAPSMIFGF